MGGVPQIDFSPLGDLPNVYNKARNDAMLSQLGQGLASGSIDYKQAAGLAAQAGRLDVALPLLDMHNSKEAGLAFLGAMPGQHPPANAPSAPAQRPIPPMATGQNGQPALGGDGGLMPPDAAPISGPRLSGAIPSSSRVWGDEEAIKAGLYDAPTRVAQAQIGPTADVSGAAPAAALTAPQSTAPQAPKLGGNMPGSGLTLIDSPALQGMPDGLRKAIPAMLASKQYAPQAFALMQKYINPEQWQLFRDTMGNVFTRNSATGESKPLIQATPQMMNANASGLPSPLAYEAATQLTGAAAKNTETTGEQKNAAASGGLTPLTYEEQKAQNADLAKVWTEKYKTATEAGVNAYRQLPQLAMVKGIVTNDKNFYSGIGEDYVLSLKKIGVAIGLDPNLAASQEVVGKVLSDQIATGLRTAFGGLGQVRVAELNVLQQSLANKTNSPEALKALVNIAMKTQQRAAAIADIAQNYDGGSGRLNAGFDRAVTQYDKTHPFLSDEEISNYRKIAGPSQPAAQAAPRGPDPAALEEARRRGLIQ